MRSASPNRGPSPEESAGDRHLFSLRGVVDDSEVERFIEAIRQLDPEVLVAVDFRHARQVYDLAMVRLAYAIADRRAVALGVSEHHLKLLRYLGIPICTRVATRLEPEAWSA